MALVVAWLKTVTLPDLLPPVLQLVFLAGHSAAGSHPISGRQGCAAVRAIEDYETADAPVGDETRLVLPAGGSASGSRGITIQQTM
jgi:hypothetical protein